MTNFNKSNTEISQGLKKRDFDLSVARDNERISFPGSTRLYVAQDAFDDDTTLSTSLGVGHAFIRIGNSTDAPVILKKGRMYVLDPTSQIFMTNSVQASKMMRIYHSVGEVIVPYASEIEIVGDVPQTQTAGTDFNILTGAAGSIPANADRKECFMQADGELRLSDTTGKGFLWGGSDLILSSKGQIDLFNDTAGTVAVKYTDFAT